jgi:hypothetical protein
LQNSLLTFTPCHAIIITESEVSYESKDSNIGNMLVGNDMLILSADDTGWH